MPKIIGDAGQSIIAPPRLWQYSRDHWGCNGSVTILPDAFQYTIFVKDDQVWIVPEASLQEQLKQSAPPFPTDWLKQWRRNSIAPWFREEVEKDSDRVRVCCLPTEVSQESCGTHTGVCCMPTTLPPEEVLQASADCSKLNL